MEEQKIDEQEVVVEEEVVDGKDGDGIDEQEWADIAAEQYPDMATKDKSDEKADEKVDPDAVKDDAPSDFDNKAEEPPVDVAAIQARINQRQASQSIESRKSQLIEKYAPVIREGIRDGEGKPITSYRDVMQLINPTTQEQFTEEEARDYYQQATQQFENEKRQIESVIGRSAEIETNLQDEALIAKETFKEILTANPGLAQSVWQQYMSTIKVIPGTDIIAEAPVSLLSFYQTVLSPYAEVSKAKAEAAAAVVRQQEADAKAQKLLADKQRANRSDIIGTGKVPTKDKELDAWEDAAKDYYNQ